MYMGIVAVGSTPFNEAYKYWILARYVNPYWVETGVPLILDAGMYLTDKK